MLYFGFRSGEKGYFDEKWEGVKNKDSSPLPQNYEFPTVQDVLERTGDMEVLPKNMEVFVFQNEMKPWSKFLFRRVITPTYLSVYYIFHFKQ